MRPRDSVGCLEIRSQAILKKGTACLGKILTEIYNAICNGEVVTKRDIYYRDPQLFKKQETVDRYIDDIAYTCDVSRKDLSVTASPKGLICGLESSDATELVPDRPESINRLTISNLHWILVVEKEASFKALVENRLIDLSVLGKGLIVTGKGYPDLATRRFVRYVLDTTTNHLPIFGLFDCDPDGFDILRCYRVGSLNLAQESQSNIPEMRWIGVKPSQCMAHPMILDASIAMTARDRNKATSMLARSEWQNNSRLVENSDIVRLGLQQILMLNKKVEIQSLNDIPGGPIGWLNDNMDV